MNYNRKLNQISYIKYLNKNPLISNIDIELTERCNNACIHCYINQPQDDKTLAHHEMDTSQVKEVIQQAADLGCLTVRFTGGEPLLREDFAELYLFSRRSGLFVTISTNATLITEDLCKLFREIPPGRPLQVTVYGMHPKSYDSVVARKGAFDEFQKGVRLLHKYKIPFEVNQCLLPQNINEIIEFEEFASELPHMRRKPNYVMNYDLRARRDNPQKNQFIKHLRYSPEETLAFVTRNADGFFNHMREFIQNNLSPMSRKVFSCDAGLGSCCVDAYGNIQMCTLLRHPDTMYPLNRKDHLTLHPQSDVSPLEYALNTFFPQIRELESSNEEYRMRCGNCFLRGLCDQCPAKSWEEHGTLDTPVEYFCSITHETARYLGILKVGEHAWVVANWKNRIENFVNSNNHGAEIV